MGYEVAENSYKTEAIGGGVNSSAAKRASRWLDSVLQCSVVWKYSYRGEERAPPLAMSHEGGWKKIKYPLPRGARGTFLVRCVTLLRRLPLSSPGLSILTYGYRCVSKDNIYVWTYVYIYIYMRGTKDLVSNRDRFIAYLREKRGRNLIAFGWMGKVLLVMVFRYDS